MCKNKVNNEPFPATFSLISSFHYTVDSKQMFNINKFLPKTGIEPQTSVSEVTTLPTEPQPLPNKCKVRIASNSEMWQMTVKGLFRVDRSSLFIIVWFMTQKLCRTISTSTFISTFRKAIASINKLSLNCFGGATTRRQLQIISYSFVLFNHQPVFLSPSSSILFGINVNHFMKDDPCFFSKFLC